MLVGRRFPAGPLKPARGGLFTAATVEEHTFDSVSWADADFTYDTIACPSKLITTDFCTNMAQGVIAQSDGANDDTHWPFGIVASYECLSVGMSLDERRKIAIEQAKAGSQKAVEHELWSGMITRAAGHGTAYLNNGNATRVTGGPTEIGLALAALEQAMGDNGLGTEGVIHMTRGAASLATAGGRLQWDGDHLRTVLGTPVSAGTGYDPRQSSPGDPITGPDDMPPPVSPNILPGNVMAYLTGPVYVHLGPVEFISEQLDWDTNMVVTQAGRPATVYWDSCAFFAAEIDLMPAASVPPQ